MSKRTAENDAPDSWAGRHARENPGHRASEGRDDPGSCRERPPIYDLVTPHCSLGPDWFRCVYDAGHDDDCFGYRINPPHQARADRDGVKVSAVVRAALEEYVSEEEER